MTLSGSMDSLLKEIDNEMEHTATSDWKLPLQDIGDETMEMLVNHNTRENKYLPSHGQESRTIAGSETSSPSKKSVVFSDGVEFHEYARVPVEELEQQKDYNDVETQWKCSHPRRHRALPAVPAREEPEEESEVEEDPELTISELKQHSVTDMAEKLSNILDSGENMHKLKQMAQEVDDYATRPEERSRGGPLTFSLQPTKPLVPDGNDQSPPEAVEFQIANDSSPSDDEDDESPLRSAADSPSRIPLTNRVSINNFNLDGASHNPTTGRISSGSSYAGSGSDLETTTTNDRYKLLQYSSDIPPELQCKPQNTDKFPQTPPKTTAHLNASNPCSLGTEYESARETPNSSVSDLSSEVLDASVENLGISDGFRGSSPSFNGASVDSEEPQGDDTLREEDLERKNPHLPDLPVPEIPSSQAERINTAATNGCEETHSYSDEDREESKDGEDYVGLHDFSSSYGSLNSEQKDETVDDNNEDVAQAEWSSLTEELNASVLPTSNLRVSSTVSQDSQQSSQSVRRVKLKRAPSLKARGPNLPPLVPTVESDPIFDENSFQEIFDTSGDSLDLTRSVKPSDYISIWHSQTGGMKPNSPVFSTNSQFSQRSVSTQSSTVSTGRNEFKFKSRIISRCRFYNPNDRPVIPSDSEDDEVIYAVDHAMDPRKRNTLISKQARNNIRQNKKINPIRAAALNLQSQGTSQKENDSWLSENYPTTLAPSESLKMQTSSSTGDELDVSAETGEVEVDAQLATSESYEFGSYEHLAALAISDANHVDLPKSSTTRTEDNSQPVEQVKSEHIAQSLESVPVRETSPLTVPPRSTDREKSVPLLTPPPRSINRKANIPTLAPPPSVKKNEKPPILLTLTREESELRNESFMNEFESPPEPLCRQRATRAASNGTQRSHEITTVSANVSEKLDLGPCLQDEGLGDDFGIYLEKLNRDDQSIQQSVKMYEGSYNIWNEEINFAEGAARKASIPSEVLNKLLETESVVEDLDENQSGNSDSSQRYIKTPTDDVFIGRGLSENGLEAIVSNGDVSERTSVLFDEFNNASIYKTPNHSPMRKTHVESPFKPVSPLRGAKSNVEKPADTNLKLQDSPTPESTESELDLEPNSDLKSISQARTTSAVSERGEHENTEDTKHSGIQPGTGKLHLQEEPLTESREEEEKFPEDVPFPDAGNLYLKLRGISGIYLRGVKRHKAQYSIEFDNGKNVAHTPWQPVTDSGELKLSKEFEVIMDRNPKNRGKVVMTLKFRYEKIQYEPKVEEVVEKVAIPSKKKLFGKRKEQYEFQKKYIQRPPKRDEWEFIFARDGSFGRCELVLDEDFLDHARFQCKTISLDLKNEWARDHGPPSKKPHQLPRRQPYIIGQLEIDTCYLARSSALEKFPRTLAIARRIMSKYKAQQSISMEGYLLQDGGDLTDNKARRYFKLRGNRLTGYHEVTRKDKIIINLLKVTEVEGHPTSVTDTPDMAEHAVAQGGFQLVFANGERIMFDTEFSTDEKYDWYRKVKRVVDLNRSHQPWVKAFYENSAITNV